MNLDIIEGQISLFDLTIQDVIKPKETIAVVPLENKFTEIINLYKESCNRIVKQVCGALIVELDDKTLYFNSEGINEFILKKDLGLLPGDEILVVNVDKVINEIQIKKLNDMQIDKYIKRKGDANIIIPCSQKTIVINPQGWVLEYEQKPIYSENECFITEIAGKSTVLDDKITKMDTDSTEFNIDDTVEIEYEGSKNIGRVTRVYNNGETINVSWDNKSTAFYYRCAKKIS